MATFNGNFHYTDNTGNRQQGPCRLEFDKESFTLAPQSAPSLSFDLGDIDGIVSDRHQLRLLLYTGAVLLLDQFGSSYDNLALELTKAHRDREVQCLLLADMPEIARFPGHFERVSAAQRCPSCGAAGGSGKFCRECGKPLAAPATATSSCPGCGARGQSGKFCHECGRPLQESASQASSGDAELRLYKTNLAVLPEHSPGFQVRLADVKHVRHEESSYNVFADLADDGLKFSALGKRTSEFAEKLQRAVSDMQTTSAQALHLAFPFLTPDQLQKLAALLPEGGCAPVSKLSQIDQRIAGALVANAVDKDLQPYYQELLKLSSSELLCAGFKLIRPEDRQASPGAAEDDSQPGSDGDAPDADQKGPDALYWFFFPIAAAHGRPRLVAWEASSRGGRATYFFRLNTSDQEGLDAQIRELNRGLGILNFRRRPIYLSDAELAMNPIFRRYAIAARRIPEVGELRNAFLGRAIHSSVEAWQEQVKGIVDKPV